MQFNPIERILYCEDLPVYDKGNGKYTQSQQGNTSIKTTHITVDKCSRIPIKEESNKKENNPLPSLSRTEVPDEDINRLPYSAVVSLTMDNKYNANGVLVGPRHILTCRHNLYNTLNNTWFKNIDVVAGLKGTVGRFGNAKVIAYCTFDVPAEDSDYDIALLFIDKPLGFRLDGNACI